MAEAIQAPKQHNYLPKVLPVKHAKDLLKPTAIESSVRDIAMLDALAKSAVCLNNFITSGK